MSEVSVAQLEAQQEEHRRQLEHAAVIRRLLANADFKSIVVDGFMTKDCARYAQESADPFLNAEQRQDALNLAQAAGHLKRYLQLQLQMSSVAQRNLEQIETALVEARAFEAWRAANPDADPNEFYGEEG